MNELKQNQKKAIIYCRVSTKEQVEEGNSLITQENICKDYADKHGYEIIEIYREQGESAKTADRTELQKLLKYCAFNKGKISAVIIYKLDRLSRNTDDYSQLRIMLKQYKVEIKSTSEQFENTPVGRFMENTLANVAQFDNDIRTERSVNGMREAMREGRYVWMAPVGYRNAKLGGKNTITLDIKLGPLMSTVFESVAANNCSVEDVRQKMTAAGLTNKKGQTLSKSYFYAMLSNKLYTGWILKFGEKHLGTFEPIVTEEVFDQVQRVLKYKGAKHGKHITDHLDFPLRRFISATTGKSLTGSWSKGRKQKYPYYRFGGSGFNFNRDKFHTAFMEFMDKFGLSETEFAALKACFKKSVANKEIDLQSDSMTVQKQIDALKAKQTFLINKSMENVIPDTVLTQQLELIDKEIYEFTNKLNKIPKEHIDMEEALLYLKEFLKKPSKIWLESRLERKLGLQWFQFPSGITFDGESFGTAEICNYFKLKSFFLTPNSSRVHSIVKTPNTPEIPKRKKELHLSEEFKVKLIKETHTLRAILEGKSTLGSAPSSCSPHASHGQNKPRLVYQPDTQNLPPSSVVPPSGP